MAETKKKKPAPAKKKPAAKKPAARKPRKTAAPPPEVEAVAAPHPVDVAVDDEDVIDAEVVAERVSARADDDEDLAPPPAPDDDEGDDEDEDDDDEDDDDDEEIAAAAAAPTSEPPPALTEEEASLSALYGDDLQAPATAHAEFRDNKSADEDRQMMPEINARDERKNRWEERREQRRRRRDERNQRRDDGRPQQASRDNNNGRPQQQQGAPDRGRDQRPDASRPNIQQRLPLGEAVVADANGHDALAASARRSAMPPRPCSRSCATASRCRSASSPR